MPKVQESGGNLFMIIPKALAQAMDIKKGDDLQVKVTGKNRLELVRE